LHRYPDALASDLRQRLSDIHGVPPGSILVGGGSDELMFLLSCAYAAGGGSVVCADPGYWGHRFPAAINGAHVHRVPCVGFRHDLGSMADREADIAFICNPHNPTGTVMGRSEIARFVDEARARLVVVDEAYIEFSDAPAELTSLPLAAAGELVILRTMSKFYGLAGARVGYMIGPRHVIEVLERIRLPFSVSSPAQAAALAALDDADHQALIRSQVLANRRSLSEMFIAAGHEVVPSQTNFVLVLAEDEPALLSRLASAGISVRPGSELGVPGSVRVTVPDDTGLAMVASALEARETPVAASRGAEEGWA
jgi:histidinol-phosphate aminotransferase